MKIKMKSACIGISVAAIIVVLDMFISRYIGYMTRDTNNYHKPVTSDEIMQHIDYYFFCFAVLSVIFFLVIYNMLKKSHKTDDANKNDIDLSLAHKIIDEVVGKDTSVIEKEKEEQERTLNKTTGTK